MSREALSVERNSGQGCGGCVLYAFFGIFFVAGSVMFYFFTISPLWSVYAARDWNETPCTVISSEVKRHRGDDSDTFSIEITYRYQVNGQQFTGDRYDFVDMSTSGRSSKQRVVKAHPPGLQTLCYVNPDDAEDSVLERGLTVDMWWGLFPIPFLAMGLGGLIFTPRLTSSKSSSPEKLPGTGVPTKSDLPAAGAPGGPVVLKPASSPLMIFLGAVFICLFWNGITGLFVVQVVQSFREGRAEWFMALFMTPFVLVGLGLLLWVGYAFLALFNPRPELTLSSGSLPLGAMGQVTWKFRGSVRAIRNFKLSVKGVEKATYRRGTDTHTDEETFFEHVFYEADHPTHIASGEAEFEVPGNSMHTFEASNNQILWTLHVSGDIPLRPDVDTSFPIQVRPHESA